MNFIEGSLNGKTFIAEGFEYDLGIKRADKGKVILGIRPEDIELAGRDGAEGEVYVIEPLGYEQVVSIKIGNSIVVAKTKPDIKLNVGDRIKLHFREDKVHLFDGETLLAMAS